MTSEAPQIGPWQRAELEPLVVTLHATERVSGDIHLIGCGFIVACRDNMAVVLTAKHNIDRAGTLQREWSRSHPSSLFAQPSSPPSTDALVFGVVFIQGGEPFHCIIDAIETDPDTDLALVVIFIDPHGLKATRFQKYVEVDCSLPAKGCETYLISNDRMTHQRIGNLNGAARFNFELAVYPGTVTEVFAEGAAGWPWPHFLTDISVAAGMSGGMFVTRSLTAFGVVSVGWNGSPGDEHGSSRSRGAILRPDFTDSKKLNAILDRGPQQDIWQRRGTITVFPSGEPILKVE